jgi:uncharacterized Zn-binding protein involved in type VI secretion
MPPAARRTDPTKHGGTITYGTQAVLIGNLPAARLGDTHVCPMTDPKPHVGGVIITSSKTVWIDYALAAREGDLCGCPSAGVSGAGVPPILGPAPPLGVSNEPGNMMNEQMDREKGGSERARGGRVAGRRQGRHLRYRPGGIQRPIGCEIKAIRTRPGRGGRSS